LTECKRPGELTEAAPGDVDREHCLVGPERTTVQERVKAQGRTNSQDPQGQAIPVRPDLGEKHQWRWSAWEKAFFGVIVAATGGPPGDGALATLRTPANHASNPTECALEYADGLVPEHDRHADNRGYGRREGHHRIRSEVHHYTPP
jgi:hypothetical protein